MDFDLKDFLKVSEQAQREPSAEQALALSTPGTFSNDELWDLNLLEFGLAGEPAAAATAGKALISGEQPENDPHVRARLIALVFTEGLFKDLFAFGDARVTMTSKELLFIDRPLEVAKASRSFLDAREICLGTDIPCHSPRGNVKHCRGHAKLNPCPRACTAAGSTTAGSAVDGAVVPTAKPEVSALVPQV
jgi:hypothetical protein